MCRVINSMSGYVGGLHREELAPPEAWMGPHLIVPKVEVPQDDKQTIIDRPTHEAHSAEGKGSRRIVRKVEFPQGGEGGE